MIAEHPIGPAAVRQRPLIGLDQGRDRRRCPRRRHQMEIERQVEAGEVGTVIGHHPVDRQIGFADHHPVAHHLVAITIGDLPHLRNGRVNLRLIHGVGPDQAARRRHPRTPVRIGWIVPQPVVLDEMVDGIDAEPVDPPLEPEPQHIEHRRPDRLVAPVEVGLLLEIGVIVIFPARRIQGPGRAAEFAEPVVRRTAIAARSRQIYQSRFALTRDARLSTNHGCRSEVWFGTKSRMMRRPLPCAAATNRSKSASDPKIGSIAQ